MDSQFRKLGDPGRKLVPTRVAIPKRLLMLSLIVLACSFAVIGCSNSAQIQCPDIADPGLYVQPSVVQVFVTDVNGAILRSGTGAVAATNDPYGQIITTANLVSDAQRIWIGFRGGANNEALLKTTFPSSDLALLTVIVPPGFPMLAISSIKEPIDTEVYSTGYVGDDYFTFKSNITKTVKDSAGHTSYAMPSTIPSAISGGPIVTKCGELIAIITQATQQNVLATAVHTGHIFQDLQSSLGSPVQAFLDQGRERLYRGEHERAIEEFSRAIQLNPTNALAYHERGYTYSRLGKFERAITDFTEAIQLDPFDASAYNYRGQVYLQIDEYDKAIRDYTQAIVESSADSYDHLLALHERASAYFDSGNYSLAIGDYTQALTVEKKHNLDQFGLTHTNFLNRGMSYHELGKYKEAIADYTEAIRISPSAARIYYRRALSYQKTNQFELAESDFKKAHDLGLQAQ
jgi:Flp pilus assembly protein TadD